jgi:hypothetical protein
MTTQIVVPPPRLRGIRTTVVIAIIIASLGLGFAIGRVTAPVGGSGFPGGTAPFGTTEGGVPLPPGAPADLQGSGGSPGN